MVIKIEEKDSTKSAIEWYKCHFQYECHNLEEYANYVEYEDEEDLLLMIDRSSDNKSYKNHFEFLDSGCSNHI